MLRSALHPGGQVIRQIAALPYRNVGRGLRAPVQVLLVTSRESGRWVIPKGNFANTVSPHAAAAQEAEEEAGVRGAVCPTPLGTYRYRKRKGSGASLMYDVEVFPLAVSEELPDWKEKKQRQRRWFSLSEAARSVEEPDLRDLIRTFNSSEFNQVARRISVLSVVAEKSKVGPMFAWFQRLLPNTGNFFELFEAHSVAITGAGDAIGRLMQGGPAVHENAREIFEREHDADDIIREVLTTVRETFLTPFDRSAITALIGSMDDAIDEMQAAASAIELYEMREFGQEMKDMAAIIVDSARLVAEAMPLLRNVGANGSRLHELTERLVRMEGHADEIHSAGLKAAFQAHRGGNAIDFIVKREIFKHLERIVDAFEDVANVIDGIVIDHS
jgi:predicted phosphate transport protein (TIGR00153 family)